VERREEATTYISKASTSFMYQTKTGKDSEICYHRAKVHNVYVFRRTSEAIPVKSRLKSQR
jgi:hypothetical protein